MQGSEFISNLRRAQQKVAGNPARFKVLACGRRWGKTTLGMVMAVRHALAGHRVWWVAPTYMLAFHPWRAFKTRFASEWDQKNESSHHIDLKSGGSITVKTADNPDGLRGVGVDFLVVDEAAFIPEEVWYACLRPALSDRKGSALIISTPAGRGWFHNLYHQGVDPDNADLRSWHFPTSANPIIDPAEIELARRTMPERNFRQEYLAEFLEGAGAVFRGLDRAVVDPASIQFDPSHNYVMGIDFARYENFTACVIIDTNTQTVVAVDRFNQDDWSLQRARIKALASKWNVWNVLAETNSMGEVNIDILRRENVPITGYKTSPSSKPGLIEALVAAVEGGDLSMIPDPVMLSELEAFTYRITQGGYTVYQAQPGHHDDTVIALALAWKLTSEPRISLGSAG